MNAHQTVEIFDLTEDCSERDYTGEMRTYARSYLQVEAEMKKAKPMLVDADTENYSDSYRWIRLPREDEWKENAEDMTLSEVEEFPNDFLAEILLAGLENGLPKEIGLSGMSIDRTGSSFHFYIAGSISLDTLRTLCEQHRPKHDWGDEM